MNNMMTKAAAAALFLCAAGYAGEAAAIAVTETGANLTKNSETAANTSAMKITLSNMEKLLQEILKALGAEGGFATNDSVGGLLSFGGDSIDLGDVVGSSRGVTQLFPDMSVLKEAGSVLGSNLGNTRITDVDQGIRTVRNVFSDVSKVSKLLGSERRQKLRELDRLRRKYLYTSADDALGTALYTREAVAKGSARVTRLSNAGRSAKNLRQQIGALTAAVTSLIEENQRMQGLMATKVQLDGAEILSRKTDGFEGLFSAPGSGAAQPPSSQGQGGNNDIFGQ